MQTFTDSVILFLFNFVLGVVAAETSGIGDERSKAGVIADGVSGPLSLELVPTPCPLSESISFRFPEDVTAGSLFAESSCLTNK